MKSEKPKRPSKLNYFQLSREFNLNGLTCEEYRHLLWYRERYEEIKKFGKFNEKVIKIRQS